MTNFPKIQKNVVDLSGQDRLRQKTKTLLAGALMTAGLLMGGVEGPAEARMPDSPVVSSPSVGGVIILTPSLGPGKADDDPILQRHFSHSSHNSHSSHYSHYSRY